MERAVADYTGTGGDDTQVGSSGEDGFDFSQGGHDTLWGGDDDDSFVMGDALDPLDVIDGGDQVNLDSVEIGGDYFAGLTITSSMLQGIEGLELEAGTYRLKLGDGVADGYFVVGMLPGATGVFDASAVTANPLNISDNIGVRMRILGGQGDDRFEIYAADRKDVLVGGAGQDQLTVQYVQDFHAAGHSFQGFEILRAVTSHKITLADGNVAAGDVLTVNAFFGLAMDVDGHKETDGRFAMNGDSQADHMVGGHLADTLAGSDGADTLIGGGGADQLTGGTGADSFVFRTSADSTVAAPDLITDLQDGDLIDLSAIDADKHQAGTQHFTLVSAFTGHAGELVVAYDAQDDLTRIMGDVNGDGRADLLIEALGDARDFTSFNGVVA